MSEAKKRPRPIIIGVTGGSGSGKTSVSRAIFDQLHGHSLMMLQEDSYYKSQDDVPFEERTKVNYDHPNAFDTDLLIEQLEDLLNWKTIEIPVYDYAAAYTEQGSRSSRTARSYHCGRYFNAKRRTFT